MLPKVDDFGGVQSDNYPGEAVPIIEAPVPADGETEFSPQTSLPFVKPAKSTLSRSELSTRAADEERPSRTIVRTSGEKREADTADEAGGEQEEPEAEKSGNAATSWVKRLIGRGKKE